MRLQPGFDSLGAHPLSAKNDAGTHDFSRHFSYISADFNNGFGISKDAFPLFQSFDITLDGFDLRHEGVVNSRSDFAGGEGSRDGGPCFASPLKPFFDVVGDGHTDGSPSTKK